MIVLLTSFYLDYIGNWDEAGGSRGSNLLIKIYRIQIGGAVKNWIWAVN